MVLSIMVIGTLISLLIWIIQRKTLGIYLRVSLLLVIAFAILGFVFYFYTSWGSLITLGREEWYEKSPFPQFTFFVLMLAGMATRYVTKQIEDRRERLRQIREKAESQEITTKPKIDFDIWEFSYPFFFSVVTFASLLSQLQDQLISLTNVMLSFQTGFFWQTILKKEK